MKVETGDQPQFATEKKKKKRRERRGEVTGGEKGVSERTQAIGRV